jgi:hypothetical protein
MDAQGATATTPGILLMVIDEMKDLHEETDLKQ